MKNILLIGVGGTGSNAVDIFYEKFNELGNQVGNNITALVFDTDAGDLKRIKSAKTVVMADNASVGTICDRLGHEVLRPWFPCDIKAVRAQEMVRGASQWRKKSYLAFLNLMNKPSERNTFIKALESMTLDPSASCEVYVIASIAGGTGSGSFIPIALYAKRYLRKTLGKDPIVNAMIALPDIYADSQTPENKVKVYANAYAILRELNAINLVSRNYNEGAKEHKKAPIRFHIGDARDPNVGLLFDASNPDYWTPEAAPFSQIFLLDRIPGLNSVQAHDIVLANSLYTMICTDIGAKFDSEFSNHELLRSQKNGSNAIYAGVSTGQIRFPKEAVLDYLAYRKTVESCNTEWLTLHNAVENAIKEKEAEAKACKRRYTMQNADYASLVVEQLEALEDAENDAIVSILERCVYKYDKEGKLIDEDAAKNLIDETYEYINEKITGYEDPGKDIAKKINAMIPEKGSADKDTVPVTAKFIKNCLLDYYQECIDNIKCFSGSTADEILTLDKKKDGYIGKKYSLVNNLIVKIDPSDNSEKYIHPVAALVLLCRARLAIAEKMTSLATEEWKELRQRNIDDVPAYLLKLENVKAEKSYYAKMGEDRFINILDRSNNKYSENKTNTNEDLKVLGNDAKKILETIYNGAQVQLACRVYNAVAKNLDELIKKYRHFFNRFEKEREDLIERQKTALRRDAGTVDSVINVFSSEKDKENIYNMVEEESGPVSEADLRETDSIVGLGVYENVFNAAAAAVADDKSWNENDSSAYRCLFKSMVDAYKRTIRKSEAFNSIATCNVIEAIERSLEDVSLKTCFKVVKEFATPSIKLVPNVAENSDIVDSSDITVFMMSLGTAKYIKKNAEEFGLHLPADQTKEMNVIKSCAEQFIKKYSGEDKARISIVEQMPDQVLYCTSEIMDISPLRISKFNEIGADNLYFRNYRMAIDNMYAYETDMWNPHLGYNLHKRGYLPYMNEEKEKECDAKIVKALLFALGNDKIVYDSSYGARNSYFFRYNGSKICVPTFANEDEKEPVTNKNIALLFTWLRNEDKLVDAWSNEFDLDIEAQMQSLPSLASDNEIGRLEDALTRSKFMKSLTDILYEDPSNKDNKNNLKVKFDGELDFVDTKGPTALEFAYMIKTTEELGRDCDDAERILDVIYDTFYKMCAYRASGEEMNDRFIKIYTQQLGRFYNSVAASRYICRTETDCKSNFDELVSWLNRSGVFKSVAKVSPIDGYGRVRINKNFDYTEASDGNNVNSILKFIIAGAKSKKDKE